MTPRRHTQSATPLALVASPTPPQRKPQQDSAEKPTTTVRSLTPYSLSSMEQDPEAILLVTRPEWGRTRDPTTCKRVELTRNTSGTPPTRTTAGPLTTVP